MSLIQSSIKSFAPGAANSFLGLSAGWIRRMDWIWIPLPMVCLLYLLALPFHPSGYVGLMTSRTDLTGFALIGLSLALLGLALNWVARIGETQNNSNLLIVMAVPAIAAGGMSTEVILETPGSSLHGLSSLPWIFVVCLVCMLLIAAWRYRKVRVVQPSGLRGNLSLGERWSDFCTLTKVGLNSLVLVSTFVGFYAASGQSLDAWLCFRTLAGTAIVAMGASVFNQLIEYKADRRMQRTKNRPLLTGKIKPPTAALLGALFSGAGLLLLCLTVNLASGFLAAISLAIYLFLYTPLKQISTLNTLAGAISGAMPPVIGWVAAGGLIEPGAIALFFILFLWQIPHFLAIAWKYRAQYRKAGFCMYSVLDPGGRATAFQALLYACLLLPVSIIPCIYGFAGKAYLLSAILFGAGFIYFCVRFFMNTDTRTARALFLSSIVYLPLLLVVLVLDGISVI
jgi:protoheme IX farnesyltransferase